MSQKIDGGITANAQLRPVAPAKTTPAGDSPARPVEAADSLRCVIAERLHALGDPEQGRVDGIAAMAASAKSFVSCAVGRFGGDA